MDGQRQPRFWRTDLLFLLKNKIPHMYLRLVTICNLDFLFARKLVSTDDREFVSVAQVILCERDEIKMKINITLLQNTRKLK